MNKDSKSPKGESRPSYTYKGAGVDIDAGNRLVTDIKPLAKATARAGTDAVLGGFGALFDLKALSYQDPLLVATTDGVGTKLKVALEVHEHKTIGIDLVAMCVNDLITQGAEPVFLLDYIAMGKLTPHIAVDVVAGIAAGCREAGCALIGGETAEMPGLYRNDDYDIAGFAVGVVERDRVLPRGDIAPGDVLLGVASSGLHSNGFSLVRQIVADEGLSYWGPAPFDPARKLGMALLDPTRIYVRSVLGGARAGKIKAIAHITGGGTSENVPRILPKGCIAAIDLESWRLPPVFRWLRERGKLEEKEMLRTLNCGIGLVLVAAPDSFALLRKALTDSGETVFEIGEIVAGQPDADPHVKFSGSLRAE